MTQRVTKRSAKTPPSLKGDPGRETLGKDRRKAARDRRQEARNLIELEEQYRALVDQSIAAIYVIQDRRIVYANSRMREIFGYATGDEFDPNPLALECPLQAAIHGPPEATRLAASVREGLYELQ
jgi:PAS domain-containing protein